jgi:hypothetical protein
VDRPLLGEVTEHLDAKASVEVIGDPLFPRPPDDLRGETTVVRGWDMMWSAIWYARSRSWSRGMISLTMP